MACANNAFVHQYSVRTAGNYVTDSCAHILQPLNRANRYAVIHWDNYGPVGIDEGIAFLEGAVQRYPEDAGLWEFLAVLYGKKGMKDKAEEAFKKSQDLKGN